MNTDEETPIKKKVDKQPTDNLTVTLDKIDAKRSEKGDEEPKPRIVLTFRSEKNSAKSSNMKIVTNEEKQEEAPRRSSRTRGKWEWVCDSDTSPKKNKSGTQTTSENDESDSSHTTPKRSTRRRSKDSDNVLANAIARKEKSYETQQAPQRLSRRIKPTAKILANEELRMGLESQNNARLGINEKSPEEGVRTRRSVRPLAMEIEKKKEPEMEVEEEMAVLGEDDDSQSQNTVMKLKHLCELGLKAISPDEAEESGNENSKLMEADDSSDADFRCSVEVASKNRPRRSTRLCSSVGFNDSDRSSPVGEDEHKSPRRSSKRSRHNYVDDSERTHRKRRRHRSSGGDEPHSEVEVEDISNPAAADEGSEAACPTDETTIIAACFCETPSNVYAAPEELTEPIFCQAIELVDGVRVGCSHSARRHRSLVSSGNPSGLAALVRAGPRAPYFLACNLHAAQLAKHMCCPACGLFCTQGTFYQCSSGHLFHLDCGLPYNDTKQVPPGCPHCGMSSYRWKTVNDNCVKVKVEMKCSNKRIFLPDQREQCTPAYLSFAVREPKPETSPIIPEDLLPSPPIDLKQLCQQAAQAPNKSPQQLCDAILRGETVDQLLPKIDLDHLDHHMRTPLMIAILALVEKPNKKKKGNKRSKSEEPERDDDKVEESEKQDKGEEKADEEDEDVRAKEEELIKVIRYLVAAGCDVNLPGPDGMTCLHLAAQHGLIGVLPILLARADVDARDHGGWTPLVWAAENNHSQVVKHIAARQGHYACVVILLARGARTDIENAAGELPVEVCTAQCQSAISLNMQMTIAVKDNLPRFKLLSSDISNGREPFPIPCVNEVDDAPLPNDFTYVTQLVMPVPIDIDNTIGTLQGCQCAEGECGGPSCSCVALGVRGWYSGGRLLPSFPYHDPPMLFECNQTCRCNMQCSDKTQLCVDAAQYGSAARFINHSCRPNLAPVRVFTDTRDLRLPTVALFAITDIQQDEELTFDYGDKFWSVKSKWMKCECGSVDCRYPTISEDTESS
ncbi:hypothetical protein HW555_010623 [Spodoptera exigua]|uniref:SET domain-containing protein n=1 Tax=Spodoptera exigua TaxID=7107 RepID=A0A835G8P3_SPOEX|nr:hypothetical protein HW555_010623 [Spodoptera exigua]